MVSRLPRLAVVQDAYPLPGNACPDASVNCFADGFIVPGAAAFDGDGDIRTFSEHFFNGVGHFSDGIQFLAIQVHAGIV